MVRPVPPTWIVLGSAVLLSVAFVTAFSASETGARTVTASVVNDSAAYLAIAKNGASPHKGFATVSSGKVTVSFGSGVATGTGINPDGTYMFDSILRVYNNGTGTVNVDVTIAGTDSSLCQVALTTGATQGDGDYSANPSSVSRDAGQSLYLGLKVLGTGKTNGQSVSCTISVTATR